MNTQRGASRFRAAVQPWRRVVRRWGLILLALLGSLWLAATVQAHEVRPAFLQIRETAQHGFAVLWKQPVMGEVAVRLIPHLSSGWLEEEPAAFSVTPRFAIKTWSIDARTTPLEGQVLTVEGLDRTITDVLVSIERSDGTSIQERLNAANTSVTLGRGRGKRPAVPAYLRLGIEHILTGVDHLLFVLALVLLVGSASGIAKTVTAFTIAHSLTLAATALGWMSVNPALVEALVALSIVFVAVELVYAWRGRRTFTVHRTWLIAFAFGLLHGAAFAGALAEIGLPHDAIPMSLFLFNLGVEIGQLAFVAAVLPLLSLAHRLPPRLTTRGRWLAPYAIGACASAWFFERVVTVFTVL